MEWLKIAFLDGNSLVADLNSVDWCAAAGMFCVRMC